MPVGSVFEMQNVFTWYLIMFCFMTAHTPLAYIGYLFYYNLNICIHGLSPGQVFQGHNQILFPYSPLSINK